MNPQTWPTREEWTAKAEHFVRTSCYASQRVSSAPTSWITEDELNEARALAAKVVRTTRAALTKAGRSSERPSLNAYGRKAASPYADIDELGSAWGQILTYAHSVSATPELADQLNGLVTAMVIRRNRAAEQALRDAIAREVARRNSDEGWQQELERRARIDGGPTVTRYAA